MDRRESNVGILTEMRRVYVSAAFDSLMFWWWRVDVSCVYVWCVMCSWLCNVLMYDVVLMCWGVQVLMCCDRVDGDALYWCVDVLMTVWITMTVVMGFCVDALMTVLMCWWLCCTLMMVLMYWCVDALMCWCVDVLSVDVLMTVLTTVLMTVLMR